MNLSKVKSYQQLYLSHLAYNQLFLIQIYYLKKEMKTIKSEMGNFQKIIDDPHFRMEMMNMMANHWDMLQNKQNQK